MPSQITFICPTCGTEFTIVELYNDEYVECPNPDCGLLISTFDYFRDPEREWQDEYEAELDYDEFLEDDEPD